jgi:hypothetical protein
MRVARRRRIGTRAPVLHEALILGCCYSSNMILHDPDDLVNIYPALTILWTKFNDNITIRTVLLHMTLMTSMWPPDSLSDFCHPTWRFNNQSSLTLHTPWSWRNLAKVNSIGHSILELWAKTRYFRKKYIRDTGPIQVIHKSTRLDIQFSSYVQKHQVHVTSGKSTLSAMGKFIFNQLGWTWSTLYKLIYVYESTRSGIQFSSYGLKHLVSLLPKNYIKCTGQIYFYKSTWSDIQFSSNDQKQSRACYF